MAKKGSVFNWQLFLGFVLIVTGGLFLADQLLDGNIMRTFWPLLVVLFGLTFLFGLILAGRTGAWLAIPGALITTLGLLLFFQNWTDLWATWTYAWALLLTAVGFGMLIMNIYLKRLGLRRAAGVVIGIGLFLFVIFGVFFEVILKISGKDINASLFLGGGLVLLGLFVIFSRLLFAKKRKPEPVQIPVEVVDVATAPVEDLLPEEEPTPAEGRIVEEEAEPEEKPIMDEEPQSDTEVLPDDDPITG